MALEGSLINQVNRIREAQTGPGQASNEGSRNSSDAEILRAREEKRAKKAGLLEEVKNNKGNRAVLEAAAANTTGLTPSKEPEKVTPDVILKQLENADKVKAWDIANIGIPEKLDKSFGWETEEVEGEQKPKLDPEGLKRKEKTAAVVDGAAKYIEKSFDGLSEAEQKDIVKKVRAGLSGVAVYDAICKGTKDNGSEMIVNILKDDALRNQMELKLTRILREAGNQQIDLADDVSKAKESLEIKKGKPDIIDKQIKLKEKEIELNKKNQKDYVEVDGVKGKKVVEKEEKIGSADTVLIERNNKRIEEININVAKLDSEISDLNKSMDENTRTIDWEKKSIGDNNDKIKELKDSVGRWEEQKKTEKDTANLTLLDKEIRAANDNISTCERSNSFSEVRIKKYEGFIEKDKENISLKTDEKGALTFETSILKEEKEPEENKKKLLENIDNEHKELIKAEGKLRRELEALKLSKIGTGQEIEEAEQIFNDLVDIKVKAEDGLQGEVEAVYGKAVRDYLTDMVRESIDAKSELDAIKEDENEFDKKYKYALNNRWDKDKRIKEGAWPIPGRKERDTKVPDIDQINRDFAKLLRDGPDAILESIVKNNCGLTSVEAELKMADKEFVDRERLKIVDQVLSRKFQTGQITGAEAAYIANTDWGQGAILRSIEKNKKEVQEALKQLSSEGVLKGSTPAEWVKEIAKSNKTNSGILTLLFSLMLFPVLAAKSLGDTLKESYNSSTAL